MAAWTLKLWFLSTFQSDVSQKTTPVLVNISTCRTLETAGTSLLLIWSSQPFVLLHFHREEVTRLINQWHLVVWKPKVTTTFICNDNILYQSQKIYLSLQVPTTPQWITHHNYQRLNNTVISIIMRVPSSAIPNHLDKKEVQYFLLWLCLLSSGKMKGYLLH